MRRFLLLFFIALVLWLAYLYFYQPFVFEKIFNYQGPGSPYVVTPSS